MENIQKDNVIFAIELTHWRFQNGFGDCPYASFLASGADGRRIDCHSQLAGRAFLSELRSIWPLIPGFTLDDVVILGFSIADSCFSK